MTDADLEQGRISPPAARMRDVARAVATAVAGAAYERGLATKPRPADLAAAVAGAMYTPEYVS